MLTSVSMVITRVCDGIEHVYKVGYPALQELKGVVYEKIMDIQKRRSRTQTISNELACCTTCDLPALLRFIQPVISGKCIFYFVTVSISLILVMLTASGQ